jgi:predicted unusual protein kinase regulating ubiquinone biosynthesis (AarF/ABC1/UbiB family)
MGTMAHWVYDGRMFLISSSLLIRSSSSVFVVIKAQKFTNLSLPWIQGVMNQLYDVMYEFNFSLPPDYALVIRALGSLEGTAKALDPDFKVIESAYPFVIGRLLEDPNPDMRKILRELLIRNNGSIRWNRLERLVGCLFSFYLLSNVAYMLNI